nr:MAG TPA: hypothetical protein [Caudoviricetes sp.]
MKGLEYVLTTWSKNSMKHTDVVKYFVSQKETNLQEQHNVCQI